MGTSWYATKLYFCDPNNSQSVDQLIVDGSDLEEHHGPAHSKFPKYLPFLYQIEIGTGDGRDLDNYARKQGYRVSGRDAEEAYAKIMTSLDSKLPKSDLPVLYYNFLDQKVESSNYLDQFLEIELSSSILGELMVFKKEIDTKIIRYFGKEWFSTIVQSIPEMDIFLDAYAVDHIIDDKMWRVFYSILEYLTSSKDRDEVTNLVYETRYEQKVEEFLTSSEKLKE